MAAYRRVYDSRHLQADCEEPGSAPDPYAGQSSMGYLYFFMIVRYMPLIWSGVCPSDAGIVSRRMNGFG